MKKNIHNLFEYQFAQKVVKEVPGILDALDRCQGICYNYIEYKDIANVMHSINEAKIMLEIHLETYRQVAMNKGKR